jgi:3-methyladenine DNA glycosylase AlkC
MEPFKNNLSATLVALIGDQLSQQLQDFDRDHFEKTILATLPGLELKQRAQLIADQMHRVLPTATTKRAKIITALLHPRGKEKAQQSDQQGITGWGMLPLGMLIGQYGIDDFDESLQLLKEMTGHFSSEFDVRYYLLNDQPRALAIMAEWVDDPDVHVRRLLSEGTRPRLPWGMQLPQLIVDPSPMLPLLHALRDDDDEYVRRSVANYLNDIAKDHPELVANIAKDWLRGASPAREKLLRHACRTLIKQGHKATLKAFGYAPPKVELKTLAIVDKELTLGHALTFSATIHSTSQLQQSLVIDYIMYFKKANGSTTGKVFKWKKVSLPAFETLVIDKSHRIKTITTRRYYAGEQGLSLRINGQDFGDQKFQLLIAD